MESNSTVVPSDDFNKNVILKSLWLTGFFVSILALLLQFFVYIFVPWCRRFDEIVLTQISIARILNTASEYVIKTESSTHLISDAIIFLWNFHTDFVLCCWMFVFTKNLYDKVVTVFHFNWQRRLWIVSLIVWVIPLPLTLFTPILMICKLDHTYFYYYYIVYCCVKILIMSLNGILFILVLKVAIPKYRSDRNRKHMNTLRTVITTLILLSISFLQVLSTDLLSILDIFQDMVINIFCVINSFQVLAVTDMFFVLVKNNCTSNRLNGVLARFNPSVTSTSSA